MCGGHSIPSGLQLYQSGTDEIGAAVMMYNGNVLQFGANDQRPSTGLYTVSTDTWQAGPVPPDDPHHPGKKLIQTDGPAVLEPNGRVLALMSAWLTAPGQGQCQAVEYTPDSGIGSFTVLQAPGQPRLCAVYGLPAKQGHMLLLPNGQVMLTYFTTRVEIFTPSSLQTPHGIRPYISSISGTLLRPGGTYWLIGIQLNGLSQASMYGDDYQSATNFPVVQVSEVDDPPGCNGQIVSLFATSNDFIPSWLPLRGNLPNSIQPANQSATHFKVPDGFQVGTCNTYNLSVITNGIQSDNSVRVTINSN
jgi:hypothetical protein